MALSFTPRNLMGMDFSPWQKPQNQMGMNFSPFGQGAGFSFAQPLSFQNRPIPGGGGRGGGGGGVGAVAPPPTPMPVGNVPPMAPPTWPSGPMQSPSPVPMPAAGSPTPYDANIASITESILGLLGGNRGGALPGATATTGPMELGFTPGGFEQFTQPTFPGVGPQGVANPIDLGMALMMGSKISPPDFNPGPNSFGGPTARIKQDTVR